MPTLTKKPDRQALYISLFLYLCYMKNYYLSILALFICQFYTFGGNNLQWKVTNLCDHVTVLNFGKTICVGTPEEVKSDPEVIRAYLGGE